MINYQDYRQQKDQFFGKDQQSPLLPKKKQIFDGLKYFQVDDTLRFELKIDEFEEKQQIKMQTSTGDLRDFTRYGKLKFTVDGEEVSLTVYHNPHGYFIPFVDTQAGKETYGAGRYLDPEQTPDGHLILDFNLAYNPYCAYNENYSCPLPPAENRLPVAIRAGEKNFK